MLTLFFANVTEWSDKAEERMRAHLSQGQVILAVETHRRAPALERVAANLAKDGATLFATEAATSVTSSDGTYGGALAATPRGLRACPLPQATWTTRFWLSDGHYLAGFFLPLGSSEQLFICCAYHRSGFQADLIRQLITLTDQGRVPFLMVAD